MKVIFDIKGNQLSGAYNANYDYSENPYYKVRDNFVFGDTLIFKDYSRGRASVQFRFIRKSTNTEVIMFISDFTEKAIPNMVNGEITGKFTFHQRGQNAGCVPIGV